MRTARGDVRPQDRAERVLVLAEPRDLRVCVCVCARVRVRACVKFLRVCVGSVRAFVCACSGVSLLGREPASVCVHACMRACMYADM